MKDTLTRCLEGCPSFDALLDEVKRAVRAAAEAQAEQIKNLYVEPAPWQSVMMADCLEKGRDISLGAKYNNYGFHGTGFSSAVAIADRILETGDASGYLKFLTTGGSDYPLNELKLAGVDLTSPQPVKDALKVFGDSVRELKALLEEL